MFSAALMCISISISMKRTSVRRSSPCTMEDSGRSTLYGFLGRFHTSSDPVTPSRQNLVDDNVQLSVEC